MFYADITHLPKTATRHKILREMADSPEGTFTRRRKLVSRRSRDYRFRYARNGFEIEGRALALVRELDTYGLFITSPTEHPGLYNEVKVALSGKGRRSLAHWDGVVDLPYTLTLEGHEVAFTIDLTGRVRAPGLAPFDVHSPDEAMNVISHALASEHVRDDVYPDRSTVALRSEE